MAKIYKHLNTQGRENKGLVRQAAIYEISGTLVVDWRLGRPKGVPTFIHQAPCVIF
jgi:hypothetical protein